jgi:hypothetical protein
VTFSNNEIVSLSGSGQYLTIFGFEAPGTNPGETVSTVSMDLLSVTGDLESSNPYSISSNQNQDGSGNALLLGEFIQTNSSVSFTGFEYSFTLDSISGTQQGFTPAWYYVSSLVAPDAIIISTPEPSSLVIFSGLGVMGLVAGWRRRKRA